MITTVKVQGDNFLVNGIKSVPSDSHNTDYQAVLFWLSGKDENYVALEIIFYEETKAHDEWLALQAAFVSVEGSTFDLIEPEITPLPDLIPNVPEPEFTQAEIDDQDEALRKQEIKDAGLALINAVFPALNDIDEIKFHAEFWKSIKPTARQATADFQSVIDIYTVAKQAITNGTASADVVWS